MQLDESIDRSTSRILKVDTKYFRNLTAEAWFINSYPKAINRSGGDGLPMFVDPGRCKLFYFSFRQSVSNLSNTVTVVYR